MRFVQKSTLNCQAVAVIALDGEEIEGAVVAGTMLDDDRFDLDQPFTVRTDDGDIRVATPWLCHIEET